ncbi:MAG: multiprotein bridging factor aMBF1 [Candidatus Thorarchaeota archaeon]
MAKKGTNSIDKQCPICGGLIWGKGQKVLIEGAKITVCESCAQYGQKVEKKPYHRERVLISPRKRNIISQQSSSKKDKIDDIEVVKDYASIIRKARNSLGLNQDQFAQKLNEKPSLLRRIESGKVAPTIKLAKKIEQVYHLKILKKADETEVSANKDKYMKKSTGASLGDIAFIKKKKT